VDSTHLKVRENPEDPMKDFSSEFEFSVKFFFNQYAPKLDNTVLFEEAYRRLKNDGCICIFPEVEYNNLGNFS